MERLIGRKKIEEIRATQKVNLIEVLESSIMAPNFYLENLECYVKDSISFMESIHSNMDLLKLLNFFNEFCPSAHFNFKDCSSGKDLSIVFGQVHCEIYLPKGYENEPYIDIYCLDKNIKRKKFFGDLNKFDLLTFRKSGYFRENSEYATLDKELKTIYNI